MATEEERCHRDQAGGMCPCGGFAVQVHHLSYKRLGDERPEDLQPVCVDCHVRAHNLGLKAVSVWNVLLRRLRIKPMVEPTKDELKQRIISRARKVVRECDQAIRDAEYWNSLPHNKNETPLDVEDFRVMRDGAMKTLTSMGVKP
jgi:hypothetical protein